jgi:phosphoglucomutase
MENELKHEVLNRAKFWLGPLFDEETKKQVQHLIDHDEKELTESFYTHLEFGTGGLRGIMGVGTNRMNKYTVALATQGFASYMKEHFSGEALKVAIAYDCRNNSVFFADVCAGVFSANGFKVFLFNSLRPTPELSFAVRHLGCCGGVMLTASHNPKEYNGFKAYWNDGGQLTAPHDKNVVNKVTSMTLEQVQFGPVKENITLLDEAFDEIYLEEVLKQSVLPEVVKRHNGLRMVYSPLHGTGVRMVPEVLRKMGFTQLFTVKEQMVTDGNFPTVKSPNPEEKAALDMALKLADEVKADLVLATDPDADRVGIAVRNEKGDLELVNGNQTAAILTYYTLKQWKEKGKITGNQYIVKTIVTSELLTDIARKYGVEVFNVLTGFKFIADIILRNEGKKQFICGGEESYGFLIGDYVRDKDAVVAVAMIAECAAWAKENGKTLFDVLVDMYMEFGVYRESLVSITKKGKDGLEEIGKMMAGYRANPPKEINGSQVVTLFDYQTQETKNLLNGTIERIDLPKSNVLQFLLEDGSLISVRPSGTEPKIKFYFGVKTDLKMRDDFRKQWDSLDAKVKAIIKSLNLD